jgi:hypothetical protein
LPETSLRGKTFRIDHPFDFAAGLITVPIRPNRFLESAVVLVPRILELRNPLMVSAGSGLRPNWGGMKI